MIQLDYRDGVYRTAPRKISFFSRRWPTLSFYARFLPLVVHGGGLAKQGRYGDEQWCGNSLYILRLLESVGVQVDITGIDVLERLETPAVIVANHMSVLETVVLPIIIHPIRPMTFVVKQSLLEYPVFKHVMRARNPISVERINPRQDYKVVVEEGRKRLDRGISVVVFPQRTRERVVDPSRFNSIGTKLAKKSGVPVVPLALLTDAWESGKMIKEFGRINPEKKACFSFGDPIRITGTGATAHHAALDFIVTRTRCFSTGAFHG